MKKLTRKLFISILAAVFAVVALGTSTFAWITISNTAVVEQFTGQVESGTSGIELSLDSADGVNGTWTTSLSLASVASVQNVKFSDITTLDGITFKDYKLSTSAPTDKPIIASDYIEVSFWARRSENATKDVTLSVDNRTVVFSHDPSDVGTYKNDVEAALGSPTNLFVDNAARMSIALANEAGNEDDVVKGVYEQHENSGNTAGYSSTGFAAKYMEAKKVVAPEKGSVTYGTTIKAGAETELEIATLTEATPAVKLTIRVWVEGFDNECHSQILNQKLSVKFGFTSAEVEPGAGA